MNDLNDLMFRASDGDPNRALDPRALLRRGRRRLYRRRGITAVSGVAAASLAIAGGIAWLPGATPDGAKSDQPPAASLPDRTSGESGSDEVSKDEVERRCTIANHNLYGGDQPDFVIDPSDQGPWHEGQLVMSKGYPNYHGSGNVSVFTMGCRIPEAGYVDTVGTIETPLPPADDRAGIRDACSRLIGLDLSDWSVLTAASDNDIAAAALRSPKGRIATCWLDPTSRFAGSWSRVMFSDDTQRYDGRGDYQVWLNCERDPAAGADVFACMDVNWLPGPKTASRIVVTEADGTTHEMPVVDDWYSFAGVLTNDKETESPGDLHFTVYAPDGSIITEYDESDLPSKAWDES